MTPKDKAKELLWKYLPIIEGWTSKEKTDLAKQCALICVDEICELNLIIGSYGLDYANQENYFEYWEEVQEEIKKL